MTLRILDWPPLQNAFEVLASRRRRHDSVAEHAVDIIQAAPGGVRVLTHL